jgi:AcrR family transcriptional regulator
VVNSVAFLDASVMFPTSEANRPNAAWKARIMSTPRTRSKRGQDAPPRVQRRNDPEATKANIIEVAMREFAENGLDGARVDEIAEKTRTSKRMIYYYFENKEGLYQAVLEKVYADIRAREANLRLEALPPEDALRKLVETTVEYDDAHPDVLRLVSIENINYARYMSRSKAIRTLNLSAIAVLEEILRRGYSEGVFRAKIDATDLHMVISALSFFRVSNRHTFGVIFRVDFSDPAVRKRHRKLIGDTVLRLVKGD